MVQWLRLCAPSARGLGLILGQGTMSHAATAAKSLQSYRTMLQLRVRMLQLKVPHASTETQYSQINKKKKESS